MGSKGMNPIPRSAARARSWHRFPLSQTIQDSGWLAKRSCRMVLRFSITRGESVLMAIPGAMAVTQDGIKTPRVSSSTRQIRQAPAGDRWGSWQRVGIGYPCSLASSRMVIPSGPLIVIPLICRVTLPIMIPFTCLSLPFQGIPNG